jgi:RNA polymerase sigma-70 factor (ECF subfamily)
MGDLSDADLFEQMKQRKSEALQVLYDRYAQIVYSLFLRTARDPATAEDLVQELFLRVWNRAQQFNPQKGSLGVWILSIARNMAVDHARSAGARFSAKVRPIEEVDYRPDLDHNKQQYSSIDDVRTVQAAFSYLSLEQKQVLELAYFEGLSQSEIAARLSEPLGTVKSWTRSALTRMRAAIRSDDVK